MYSTHAANMFYFALYQVQIKRGGLGHGEINLKKPKKGSANREKTRRKKDGEKNA